MKWFWVFPVIMIVFGVVVVAYGMKFSDKYYKRMKKEGTDFHGGVSDTLLFAVVELIFVLFLDWFVRFLPKWLIKAFIIALGLGFVAIGIFLLIVV